MKGSPHIVNEQVIETLIREAKQLEERLAAIRLTISTLEQLGTFPVLMPEGNATLKEGSPTSTNAYEGYTKNASFAFKISCLLKNENRFLHVREIIDIIGNLEGLSDSERSKLRNGINPALSVMKKKNLIVSHRAGTGNMNTFYGSPKWLNEDGTIKLEHLYDEKQVTKTQDYDI